MIREISSLESFVDSEWEKVKFEGGVICKADRREISDVARKVIKDPEYEYLKGETGMILWEVYSSEGDYLGWHFLRRKIRTP